MNGLSSAKSDPGPANQRSGAETTGGSSPARWWLLLIALAGVSLTTFLARHYVLDDAYITYRYSYHLGQEGRAFWNPAQFDRPTQGYTSLAWMLLNVIPALLVEQREALLLWSRLLAFLSALAVAFLLIDRVRASTPDLAPAALIVALLFVQPAIGFHVASGMETMLFGALVLGAVHVRVRDPGNRRLADYLLACLAAMVRPEGALALGVLGLHDLARGRARRMLLGALLGGATIAVLLAYSLVLHGVWVPNTFHSKQSSGVDAEAVRYTLLFLVTLGAGPLLGALFAARRNLPGARLSVAIALLYLAYFLSVRPWMNIMARFQWVAFLLLLFAAVPVALGWLRAWRSRPLPAIAVVGWLSVSAVGNFVGVDYMSRGTGGAMRVLEAFGMELHTLQREDRWLVYHDAGAVCYFSDWNCYETIGLNLRRAELEAWPREQMLSDPRVVLWLGNSRGEDRVRRTAELDEQLSQHGFRFSQAIPLLALEGQREFYVLAYSKPNLAPEVDALLQNFEPPLDTSPIWSWHLYEQARRLLKGLR